MNIRHKLENGFFDVKQFIFPFWKKEDIVAKTEMHWIPKSVNSPCVCHIISIYDPIHRFETMNTVCECELEKAVRKAYKLHCAALRKYLNE